MNIYQYQRLLGKIDDIPELKSEFISIYDAKSHQEIVQFCLTLAEHVLEMTGFDPCNEINASFNAMKRWIGGEVNYHEARNLSIEISRLARAEEDPIKVRFFRTMAQIAASPHVKYHGLWATDFAVALVNRMYPGNMDKVRNEREKQIELIKNL